MGDVSVGAGDIWEIPVTSSQFCCELKTDLKNLKKKILKKKLVLKIWTQNHKIKRHKLDFILPLKN